MVWEGVVMLDLYDVIARTGAPQHLVVTPSQHPLVLQARLMDTIAPYLAWTQLLPQTQAMPTYQPPAKQTTTRLNPARSVTVPRRRTTPQVVQQPAPQPISVTPLSVPIPTPVPTPVTPNVLPLPITPTPDSRVTYTSPNSDLFNAGLALYNALDLNELYNPYDPTLDPGLRGAFFRAFSNLFNNLSPDPYSAEEY